MFLDKDDVRWVCFGKGSVAFGHSDVYDAENGPQIEVQLRDAITEHPISKMAEVPAGTINSMPCKVVLGFNKLESLDAFMSCLEEARVALAARLESKP